MVTVPANFNTTQIRATKDAAELAGWTVERILTEPVAAALAYMNHPNTNFDDDECGETVIVYDFGGGTLDVTAVHLENGSLEVLTTEGNHRCGGQDVDQVIIDWLVEKIEEETEIDCRE